MNGRPHPARLDRCARCASDILVGLDDVVCAFTARVDPDPITFVGEVVALADGRRTYSGHYDALSGKVELTRRDVYRLALRDSPVYVEHRCYEPLPAHMVTPRAITKVGGPNAGEEDEPPF